MVITETTDGLATLCPRPSANAEMTKLSEHKCSLYNALLTIHQYVCGTNRYISSATGHQQPTGVTGTVSETLADETCTTTRYLR